MLIGIVFLVITAALFGKYCRDYFLTVFVTGQDKNLYF